MTADVVIRSESPEATEALGEAIGALLEPGAVVALDGDLGAGKTALTRGLARGLGVEEPVTSPSFTLMHEYRGRLTVYHFDAWMTGREEAFLEGGGAEALAADGVGIVEWASRVEEFLPPQRLEVLLEHVGLTERRLVLRLHGPPDGREDLRRALEAAGRLGGGELGSAAPGAGVSEAGAPPAAEES